MLTRYDPFREMLAIRNTMERLLDSAVTGTSTLQPATLGLALDVAESENEYVVKASLPGIYLDDLEITYANNTLTIKGEVREEQELEEARYHLRERSYGSFARSITLLAGVESDKIEANYEAGRAHTPPLRHGALSAHEPLLQGSRPSRNTVRRPKERLAPGLVEALPPRDPPTRDARGRERTPNGVPMGGPSGLG